MPSFKATVLSDIDLDGSKILRLYRIRERDPVELVGDGGDARRKR